MKKILLGAILASTLAMSGDLSKCSEAIMYQDEFSDRWLEDSGKEHEYTSTFDSKKKHYNERRLERRRKKMETYGRLVELWNEEALKSCKGVLDDVEYEYVTTPSIRER